MSEYSSLKATINASVKTNGNQEITGSIMNSVLNAMVNSLGAGYQFIGVATPTNPDSTQTPDYKCFYLATTPGTYTNLGRLVVADGEVALLKWDSAWTKEVTGIATADQVSQLGQQVTGFYPFEIGGISAQTGDNDDTIVTQFRSIDYWPISSNPTITATDGQNSLETGVRFYDTNKTFVGYTYTGSARFVRFVVVSANSQVVTPEYMHGCEVVFNGTILKEIIGVNEATGVSFNDENTERIKGKNVQLTLENIDRNIVGVSIYEQGGISSQTGENNDNIAKQFRYKGYYPITSNPTITARDYYGNSLETGVRFYDSNKNYVGYTYTGSARFVRFVVVVTNEEITEIYISKCTITVNGVQVKDLLGLSTAIGISFNDKRTAIKGKTVQEIVENIDSEISGDILFEQGGISAQTGDNDNTRPLQIRSIDYYPITSNPTITARDYYGNSLETGVRFYDEQKQYLSYTYPGTNAKFVRIVVVCKEPAYLGQVKAAVITFNGVTLNAIYPSDMAVGTSFDNRGTIIDANDVQNALVFFDRKEKGLTPVIVGEWNVGQFGGGRGQSEVNPQNYNSEVYKWNKTVRSLYPTLWGMVEYNPVFGTNPNNAQVSPDDVVWDFYKYKEVFRQPEVSSYWGGNALNSMLKLSNAEKVKYACNQGVIAPDPTTQHLLDEVAFYTKADMQIYGITVKVAVCTIAFNSSDPSDNTYQAAQYSELVSIFGQYDHAILIGDFETADDTSLQVFTNAGFKLANGGSFGWFKTCPNTNIGNGHLDNIIVKGFNIVGVEMDVNDLSDHYPLISKLQIIP